MGDIVADLGQANAATVALAAVSLLLLIGLRLFLPRFPAALLVVVLGIVASWSLDLAAHSVNVAGPVPAGLPEFAIPRVGGSSWRSWLASRAVSSWSASPDATLAAIIVTGAVRLLDPDQWRELARSDRAELVIAVVTALRRCQQ